MRAMHWRGMGVMVAATLFAAVACGTRDDASDSAGTDTGAVTASAGGDVASSPSPAIVVGFLTTVNRGEIEAAELARDKATNARVKEYARMMLTDHGRALKESGSADTAAAAAPVGQPAVDAQAKHEQEMNTLRTTAKGRAFDSTYMAMMVAGHQDVLARLEAMKSTGNSASATPAGSTSTPAAAPSTTAGTGNPAAVGSPGTTQPAGSALNDPVQTNLQNSIEMVRTHLERAQEIQRSLQGGS
jgi:putative membrane protein